MVEEDSVEEELPLQESVRRKCMVSQGRMTVFRLENIVRDEVITRGLERLEKEQRERPASGKGIATAMSFEPLLCTEAIQQTDKFTDPPSTGSSKVKETDFHSTHEKVFWPLKLPTMMRRLACRIPLGRSPTSSKVSKVEAL